MLWPHPLHRVHHQKVGVARECSDFFIHACFNQGQSIYLSIYDTIQYNTIHILMLNIHNFF